MPHFGFPLPVLFPLFLTVSVAVTRAAPVHGEESVPGRRLLAPKVFVTAHELANPHLYRPRHENVYVPPPSTLPPPPAGVVRPGEFEPMDSVLIAVLNYGYEFYDMWAEMVGVFQNAGHTWIIAGPSDREELEWRMFFGGVEASAYSWLNYPIDSIWIRDYGPEFVVRPDGVRHVIDADYSHRPRDNVIPLRVAASDWIAADGMPLDAHSHLHELSGGNIISDGAGTCFFSDIVYGSEKPAGWSKADVDDLMREYLGCQQMIVLNPICLDGTGHIDLYAKLVSPTSMLLGEFSPDTLFRGTIYVDDPWNCTENYVDDYQDQEDNLAIIEASTNLDGEPWQVTRVPMPEPYLLGPDWIYRSYLNAQLFNGWVAMPAYYRPWGEESAEDLLDMEALAIAAYEAALPGVSVVPIDADVIIGLSGAIHCIAHEIPAEEGWEPPASYCGDSLIQAELGEECDGSDFDGLTCRDFGFDGGNLSCDLRCRIDTSGCVDDAEQDTDSDTDPEDPGDHVRSSGGDGCGCRAGTALGRSPLLRSMLLVLRG